MTNFWKQFVEWATGLRDDPFIKARSRLTALYALSVAVILAVSFFVIEVLGDQILYSHPALMRNPSVDIAMLSEALSKNIAYVLLVVAGIMISVNYFVAGKTLSPIRQILRTQKRFIADASHELRTPLAIMKTSSEVALLDGMDLTANNSIQVLKSNLEEIERMSKIIENLLSLSYYDSKVTEIPFTPVNLADVVKNITNKAQSLAIKKRVSLDLTKSDEGMVMGNPTALEQMTMNLIKNALTYTPRGGKVSDRIESRNKSNVELKIADTGIGISEKDLPHVFSPFYKAGVGRSQDQEVGSSGLGLTIVKKIVDRHRGDISVSSEVGKGTCFTVIFPQIQMVDLKKRTSASH